METSKKTSDYFCQFQYRRSGINVKNARVIFLRGMRIYIIRNRIEGGGVGDRGRGRGRGRGGGRGRGRGRERREDARKGGGAGGGEEGMIIAERGSNSLKLLMIIAERG